MQRKHWTKEEMGRLIDYVERHHHNGTPLMDLAATSNEGATAWGKHANALNKIHERDSSAATWYKTYTRAKKRINGTSQSRKRIFWGSKRHKKLLGDCGEIFIHEKNRTLLDYTLEHHHSPSCVAIWEEYGDTFCEKYGRHLQPKSWIERVLMAADEHKVRLGEPVPLLPELVANKAQEVAQVLTDGAEAEKAKCNSKIKAIAAKHAAPAPTAPDKDLIDALEEEGMVSLVIALYRGQTLEEYARKLIK